MQFVEEAPWIPAFRIHYHLGVDGISMPLVLLTTFHHRARGGGRAGGRRAPRIAVHGFLPHPGRAHGGGVLRPRRHPVLRLLGGVARSDVPHHRDLGRGEPGVRDRQVLPLHLPRLGADAGRLPLPLRGGGELPDPRLPRRAARSHGPDLRLPRVPRGVRGQGADVAGAHLAPRRPRGGPDGGVGDPRRHHAEARRVRLLPVQPAHRAGCEQRASTG